MKPIYLEFCGVNSFSQITKIDFKSLLAGGVFGIFGDTGSGKSTILDCIHLALYGVVERASKSMADCINYNLDSAYVLFEFEITTDGIRRLYKVKRERKRKNNGSKAYLYVEQEDGKWLALAEGTRDVDEKIGEIIGLNFNDFKMCIALPQGDFAALVKAGTADRVKLVSRLFDLEKYGEKLSKAVNEKYYNAENEVKLIKAEMGQNEGGNDENIQQKRSELGVEKKALAALETELLEAEKQLEKEVSLAKEKADYDVLLRQLSALEGRLEEMQEKRKSAERLPAARMIDEKAKAVEENNREKLQAQNRQLLAEEGLQKAEKKLEIAKKQVEEGDFDNKIVALSVTLERVKNAQEDMQTAKDAKKRLDECIEGYKALSKKCPQEDFEGIKARLEQTLSTLGEDESFTDYIKHNFKDGLLKEERREVQKDLIFLSNKYPQTGEDVEKLLEKYAVSESQEELDITFLHKRFKEIEAGRKELKAELEGVLKRQREYEANEKQKELLTEQGKIYRKSYDTAQAKIQAVQELSLEDTQKALDKAREGKQLALANVDEAQKDVQSYLSEMEKQKESFRLRSQMQESLQAALVKSLQEGNFEVVEDARSLIRRLGDEERVVSECKAFFEKYELVKSKIAETDTSKFEAFDENAQGRARARKQDLQFKKDESNRKIASLETQIRSLEEIRERYKAFEKALIEKEKEKNLCDELRSLLRNNRFLEFIASEYLQEICISASKTLLSLTSGRYFLKYEKEFKVGDNLDGGNLRAVKTLSGGETFLVSLSLALSLSGAICQKSLRPIEFFFLDEGFGTLDEKLIDTVMDVLGKLSKDFAVGLISHVEELKHRIENKILVTGATEKHGSTVRVECF